MSNQATVSAIPGPATVPTGVAYITGQIRFKSKAITTKSGRLFLTVIALPAPDEFTSPAILELRSTEPLGEPGESFRGKVRHGGYPNSFAGKDGTTVNSARNSLDVVA